MYAGSRKLPFQLCIYQTLMRSRTFNSVETMINSIDPDSYDKVFTHKSYDETVNYEFYEFIGDSIAGTSVVLDIAYRFPKLAGRSDCVGILARLKTVLVSKKTFSQFAELCGFWDFVSASEDVRAREKKKILEDVFEAFLGHSYTVIEADFPNFGMTVCREIVTSILDNHHISYDYLDLYDAKTRLKELGDKNKELLPIKYENSKTVDAANRTVHRTFVTCAGRRVAEASAPTLLIAAQQDAAARAIERLTGEGIEEKLPQIYLKLAAEENTC